jgi:hypothetical protein
VVDAAGAIYVIGGYGSTLLNDVWASTDGGADWTRAGDGLGYSVGIPGKLRGTTRLLEGCYRATQGYYKGNRGIPWGTRGVPRG